MPGRRLTLRIGRPRRRAPGHPSTVAHHRRADHPCPRQGLLPVRGSGAERHRRLSPRPRQRAGIVCREPAPPARPRRCRAASRRGDRGARPVAARRRRAHGRGAARAGDELRFAPSSTTRSTSARRSSLSTSCPPSRSTAAGSSERCSGGALRIATRPRHWPRGAAGCSGLCSSHSASGPSCPEPIGGLWLALVGGFIVVAAAAEAQRATIERELAGRIVATVMTTPAVTLAADLTLREAVVVGFSRQLFSALPVVGPDDGRSAC